MDIREVSDITGVQPTTLRFYEKKGLIRSVGRNGLRRQYHESVLGKLQLIALGQAAGFTLDEIVPMLNTSGSVALDREMLLNRAAEIDWAISRLRQISRGLKHVARCHKAEHGECEEFRKTVKKGLRLIHWPE
ncbi:MerR family transcriptional regulator [Erwinia sp. S59]|uniref:MerR family transcriptional regulator n=1 Tax=Erwinia sp. S59 TaxID=2769340 RepID=UPI00190DDE87|nr:MerR family transcriptional regulator [Erwinia sp. S59]MBK0094212.1 MerR family transcriptional regulator [Erwinia sp. S59]